MLQLPLPQHMLRKTRPRPLLHFPIRTDGLFHPGPGLPLAQRPRGRRQGGQTKGTESLPAPRSTRRPPQEGRDSSGEGRSPVRAQRTAAGSHHPVPPAPWMADQRDPKHLLLQKQPRGDLGQRKMGAPGESRLQLRIRPPAAPLPVCTGPWEGHRCESAPGTEDHPPHPAPVLEEPTRLCFL